MLFSGHVVLYLTLFDDDNNLITYSISCVTSLYCTCKKFVKKKKKCIVISVCIYFYDNLIYKTIVICTYDMHIVYFFKRCWKWCFSVFAFPGSHFHLDITCLCQQSLNIFFKEQIWVMSPYESDMDPLLRPKKRSIICLRQYLCVEYWNMTFLPNCPFMLTLIELIKLKNQSTSLSM